MAGLGYGEVSSAAPGSSGASSGGGHGILGNVLGAPLHFTEHLLSDVGDAAIGFVPGTYHLITDPVDSVEAIGKGIAHDWAPLFTGHPGEWAKNFYEHPLGPILDVAALFTGGATAAGKGASLLSKAEYAGVTARGAARAGLKNTSERVIVEGGSKPGQFAKRMAEPSRVDRLAAYYREGSRTLYKHDTVGAKGRIRVGDEARFDIPYQTGRGVAQKWRAEQVQKLMDNFATRGGTLGGIQQMSYEMAHAARLGGSVGALRFQMQQLDKYLEKVYDPATGQVKHHGMKQIANDWYDRLVAHAVESNRFVEVGGKWNEVSYSPVATRSSITRSRKHYHKGGVVEKRGFGSGGKERALNDMKHLGHRIVNPKETATFSGKDLIEKWGADAGKIDPNKRYHVLADRHTARNLGVDAARSTNFLMSKFYRGTSIWKTIILGYSPRFFVNNFIGNGLMFSMNYMGSGALFGLRQYMRAKHGIKGWKMADADMAKAIKEMGPQRWLQQHFANQLGQSLHESSLSTKGARGTLFDNPGQGTTLLERGAQKGFFKWAGSHAEQNYRIAAIMIEVRADARVTAAMKRMHKKDPSLSRDELFDRAASQVLSKNPDLVRTVNKNVEDVMGNYSSLIGPERALKTISPFYAWQRHIVRNSLHMALDKPIRTTLMSKVGEMGSDWVTKEYGGVIPHFGQGLLPIGGNKPNGGILRRPIISTASFNPWAQVGELARTGQATIGLASGSTEGMPRLGETYGSLLNPFVTAGIGAIAEKNLFTGAPQTARQGLASPLTGLPQYKLGDALLNPPDPGAPTLYKKGPEQEFMALLGITKKDLWEAKLAQLGLSEKKGG